MPRVRYISDWATDDQDILLNFSDSVLQVFQSHAQTGSRPESGGVLLGTVHDRGLMVTEATVPTKWDRQFRFLFERSPFGHRAAARRAWKKSNGVVRYIGEWHTHPQDVPLPSSIDLDEWRKLAKVRADGRPLLAVIVGRKGLHVELIDGEGSRQLFQRIR